MSADKKRWAANDAKYTNYKPKETSFVFIREDSWLILAA